MPILTPRPPWLPLSMRQVQGLSALAYLAGNDDFEDVMLSDNGAAVVLAAMGNHPSVGMLAAMC